ncbi:MAG TPA: HdeD family acid-resistance protein [Pseudonocardiaceae bacterium]
MTGAAHSSERTADQTAAMLGQVGGSPGWAIGLGVVSILAGILIVVWPGLTVLAFAVIFGVWLLVAGIFRLVAAFAFSEVPGFQVLLGVLGVLSILVGILCLRHPLQTLAVLALVLGVFWVVSGIIEIVHGISGDVPSRGWAITSGVIGVLAGIAVLVYPALSLVTLAWVLGIMLIIHGAIAIWRGIAAQRFPMPARSAGAALT